MTGAGCSVAGPDVVLDAATWRDIPRLVELETLLFPDQPWSEHTWWEEFAARPRRHYIVARRGADVVGYAGVDLAGSAADVMTIATAPNERGTGLGRRLMDRLVETAQAAGAEALLLEVRADNAAARRLYDKLGFAQLTVRRRYYQPGDVDAVIMRKLLETS